MPVLQAEAQLVIQQYSRKLLMMDILMPETCWVHKKWKKKIASDIKLVFYSSTITMMHGPINIRIIYVCFGILNQIELFGRNSDLLLKTYVCQLTDVSKSFITGQFDF